MTIFWIINWSNNNDKKISFIILDNTGSPVKNVTVSKALFRFIGLCFVTVLILTAFVFYNYYSLSKQALLKALTSPKITKQITNLDNIQNSLSQLSVFISNQKNELKETEKKVLLLQKEREILDSLVQVDKDKIDTILEYHRKQADKQIWKFTIIGVVLGFFATIFAELLVLNFFRVKITKVQSDENKDASK